jgi:hypothetical protein
VSRSRLQWLAEDARRAQGAMVAVVVDATRAEVPVPEEIRRSLVTWRDWYRDLEQRAAAE